MSDKIYWKGPGTLELDESTHVAPGGVLPRDKCSQEALDRFIASGQVTMLEPDDKPEEVASVPPPKAVKPWTFTPEQLTGKTLAQLNELIAETAELHKVGAPEPFETLEEADAFLQQDG